MMEKIARPFFLLDEALLDRVYQPIADRLAGWRNAIQLATLCFDLMICIEGYELGREIIRGDEILITLQAFSLLIFITVRVMIIPRFPRKVRMGMRNPMRFIWLPLRLVFLVLSIKDIALIPLTGPLWIQLTWDAAYVSALYFASCDLRPPMIKRTVPQGAYGLT
jgi:hypothetical protein